MRTQPIYLQHEESEDLSGEQGLSCMMRQVIGFNQLQTKSIQLPDWCKAETTVHVEAEWMFQVMNLC